VSKKQKELLEIRLSLIKKELTSTVEGESEVDDKATEKHVQHVSFHITDPVLAKAISDLLSEALSKEHMDEVPKDKDGEPLLDGHKFELTGKKPEKKKSAA
jgi:hypothetical protein